MADFSKVDAKYEQIRDVIFGGVKTIVDKYPEVTLFYTSVQQNRTDLPANYVVLHNNEGELEKYTLERKLQKQHSVLVIEMQSDKTYEQKMRKIQRCIKQLFTKSYSEYNLKIDSVNGANGANRQGHKFSVIVEYNFILEKC